MSLCVFVCMCMPAPPRVFEFCMSTTSMSWERGIWAIDPQSRLTYQMRQSDSVSVWECICLCETAGVHMYEWGEGCGSLELTNTVHDARGFFLCFFYFSNRYQWNEFSNSFISKPFIMTTDLFLQNIRLILLWGCNFVVT